MVTSYNKYIIHNDILYVLRLNEDCKDAHIETYQLTDHPNLKGKFDVDITGNNNISELEKRKLVEENLGKIRLISFSPTKEEIEKELKQVRQSLKNYYDSIDKTFKCLEEQGFDSIRQEESIRDLDVCSFSDTIYLYDRPLIKLIYRLGNIVRMNLEATEYDIPCWEIAFMHNDDNFYISRPSDQSDKINTIDELLEAVTKEPGNSDKDRNEIVAQIEKSFGSKIHTSDILYDPAAQCYLLKKEAEEKLIKDLIPVHDTEQEEIAKYTTFDTLIAILKSNKIRMNSIASMNDKTETDFLEDKIKNYKDKYERDLDKYLFADKEFIISFTKRVDDLDMWRLYGDNAQGICLVFKRKDKENDELYKINYVDPENPTLAKIDEFNNLLKSKNIRFYFWLLHKYCHFIKHTDYHSEDEYRYLERSDSPDGWFVNRDNGILTPFIEKSLKQEDEDRNSYPFILQKIILGPAMRENDVNMTQVFYMITHKDEYTTVNAVSTSKIDSYR